MIIGSSVIFNGETNWRPNYTGLDLSDGNRPWQVKAPFYSVVMGPFYTRKKNSELFLGGCLGNLDKIAITFIYFENYFDILSSPDASVYKSLDYNTQIMSITGI